MFPPLYKQVSDYSCSFIAILDIAGKCGHNCGCNVIAASPKNLEVVANIAVSNHDSL